MSTDAASLTTGELELIGAVAQAMLWDETWGLFVAEDTGDNLDQLFELREHFRAVNALISLPPEVPFGERAVKRFVEALPEGGAVFSRLLSGWLDTTSAYATPTGPEVIPTHLTQMMEQASSAVAILRRLGY